MPVITLFSGSFCREETVLETLISETGCKLVSDNHLTARAAELSGIPAKKIERAFVGKMLYNKKYINSFR